MMKTHQVDPRRINWISIRHPWSLSRRLARRHGPGIAHKLREKAFGALLSGFCGAALAIGAFFVTSNDTQLTKVRRSMQAEVSQKLDQLGTAKHSKNAVIERIDAFIRFPLTAVADTIVMQGRFEPQNNLDGVEPGTRNGLFIALFEEAPRSLLDAIAGREGAKRLTTLITTRGYLEPRVDNIRVEDVFQTGEKAIVFDLVEDFASGRSISPVILYKYSNVWKPTLLPDFSEEAARAIEELVRQNAFDPSFRFEELLKSPSEWPKHALYLEELEMQVNADHYSFIGLRNSSGYAYEKHPKFGYRNLVAVASFRDDATNSPHRVYVKVMKLVKEGNSTKWEQDQSWNNGSSLLSAQPLHYNTLNLSELFFCGFSKVDHVTFFGTHYGKETPIPKCD